MISPLYGDVCRYYPTCSAYGLGAVQQFGVLRGGVMTLLRIVRCNPWARGGIDDIPARMDGNFPLSRSGFVIPKKKEK
jgi:putative membrane protein insertion efficiency factor